MTILPDTAPNPDAGCGFGNLSKSAPLAKKSRINDEQTIRGAIEKNAKDNVIQ